MNKPRKPATHTPAPSEPTSTKRPAKTAKAARPVKARPPAASTPPAAAEQAFPQGTAWYPDHWPEQQWDADLARIADAGISIVRFGEFSWSWFEPSDNAFDFAAYDRFVNLAHKRGLKLILCTPTATLPPWLLARYPDCRLVNDRGEPCFSHRHHWCWNHTGSAALVKRCIRRLARQYGRHPAVIGWQIDNETNLGEDTTQIYDFHPATLARFRTWLQSRYDKSLEKLDEAWYSNFWSQRYSDWKQIGLTHMPHRANPCYWLDFTRFREQNLADMIRWQAAILRSETRNQSIGTNIPEVGAMSLPIAIDPFDQPRSLDWIGTDLYYASGNRREDLANAAYSVDLMRCAAHAANVPDFFVCETQAGPHQRTWHATFAAEAFDTDYLRDLARVYATHGASKIFWFLWRPTPAGVEMGMNGMQRPDGQDSARTELVRDIARSPHRLHKLRHTHMRRPRAFIHYARDTLRFISYWKQQASVEAAFRGAHRLLDLAGFQVDMLDDAQLARFESLQAGPDCPLLLPRSDLLNAEQIDAIRAHAKAGGPILAGMSTGMIDHHGHLYASPPLEDLFSARFGLLVDTGPLAATTIAKIPVNAYRRLLPIDAKVTKSFSNKLPAILEHQSCTLLAFDGFSAAVNASEAEAERLLKLLAIRTPGR